MTSDAIPEPLSGTHTVVLHTTMGDITVELNADAAPKTVTNFVTLTERGYYTDILFHRVIPGFMIQGGDPKGTGSGGESIYGDTFEDELGEDLTIHRGTIAMANRGPNTNGSQFFILQAKQYEGPYTPFGKVISGMDIVDAIAEVEADARDKPVEEMRFTAQYQGPRG